METMRISINTRTARLKKAPAILAERYSEFPVNRDSMYSVELQEGTQTFNTRQLIDLFGFLRNNQHVLDFLHALVGQETELAAIAARLLGNARVYGEDAADDEHMYGLFELKRAGMRPHIQGSELVFVQQIWRTPDSLIGECEKINLDLETGAITRIDPIPLRAEP